MKALTVCQPYASMIVSGQKLIENRTWRTWYSGPLIIHAGKSLAWFTDEDPADYPLGRAIGVVELVDGVVRNHVVNQLVDYCGLDEVAAREQYEKHANGPYCWVLRNPMRFAQSIEIRGAQGLWNCDDAHVLHEVGRTMKNAEAA